MSLSSRLNPRRGWCKFLIHSQLVRGTGDNLDFQPVSEAGSLGDWALHLWNLMLSLGMLNSVQLFASPWTTAHQAPLSMEFFRQEYWRGLPLPSPGDLPNPGIKPTSPALQAASYHLSQYRIELKCRKHSWCQRTAWWYRVKHTHIVIRVRIFKQNTQNYRIPNL